MSPIMIRIAKHLKESEFTNLKRKELDGFTEQEWHLWLRYISAVKTLLYETERIK